ncbi:PG0870-related protein (plasmid) [Bacteroides thetaiotaomicron]|nr:PG0870-related protein [Bacteroides thetaiotaomicron]
MGQWDRMGQPTINHQKRTKLWAIIHYRSIKGTATRHTCPKCGDRHSFVYYVDENNVPLHPSVGRCNHESGCGYHYTPKEYFQEHPEHRTTNDFSFDRQRAEQKKVKQQRADSHRLYFPSLCGEVAKRA